MWGHRMPPEPFAAQVRRLMSERGLTQAALAEMLEMTQPAISMMLAGKYQPRPRTVRLIAQALGVAESDLWPDAPPQPR